MVMLSHLFSATVRDAHQQHAKVLDLAITLFEDDYPPVTHLYCYPSHPPTRVRPGAAVQSLDWGARQITVADLGRGSEIPPPSLKPPSG